MAHRIARTDGVVDSNALTGAEAIPWLILTRDCAAAPQGARRERFNCRSLMRMAGGLKLVPGARILSPLSEVRGQTRFNVEVAW